MSNPAIYTVGWICAVTTEIVAARSFLDEEHDSVDSLPPHDANKYRLGRIGKHNVVIANLALWQYGTTNAASVINHMIRTFPNLRFCLMVGIGGGVPTKRDIRLGDIVVSIPDHGKGGVYEYDYGKALQDKVFEPTGALNQPPLVLLNAANALRAEYEFKGMDFIKKVAAKVQNLPPNVHSKYSRPRYDRLYQPEVIHGASHETPCCKNLDESPRDESALLVERPARHSEEPIIHYGLIASGNKLMKDAKTRDALAKEHDVICFETEAAGLMNQFDTLVIRGICDYSDTHKNSEWQGFAALAAALYARDLLLEIAPTTVENSERLVEQLSKLESWFEEQHSNEILRWLSEVSFNRQQRHYSLKRQPGTGHWFLNSQQYQSWLNKPGQVLICTGPAGSGKSVLMSMVVNDLKTRRLESTTTGVAYAYCSTGSSEKLSIDDLVCGIVKQFSHGQPPYQRIENELKALYQTCRTADDPRPPKDQIDKLLRRAIGASDRFFLVIDDADLVNEVSAYACWLKEMSGLNLMLTFKDITGSRKPDITEFPIEPLEIDILAHAEAIERDINLYIERRLVELPKSFHENAGLRAYIGATITEKSYGTFSLAPALFAMVKTQPAAKRIRTALEAIKSQPNEILTGIYEDAMDRIADSHPVVRELAYQALCWTTMIFDAPRGLSIAAFQHALAVEIDHAGIDPENIPDMDQVFASVPEFLDPVGKGDHVRLRDDSMHYFFDTTSCVSHEGSPSSYDLPPNKDIYMVSVCVLYLERCLDRSAGVGRSVLSDQFPFYFYANRWWPHHARCWIQDRDGLTNYQDQFLTTSPKLGNTTLGIKMHGLITSFDSMGNRRENSPAAMMEALSEAAFYGLVEVVQKMLKDGFFQTKSDPTPLLAAFEGAYLALTQGHYRGSRYRTDKDEDNKNDKVTEVFSKIIKSLRDHGAFVNIDSNDKSALASAVSQKYHSLVHILRNHNAKQQSLTIMKAEKNGAVPLGKIIGGGVKSKHLLRARSLPEKSPRKSPRNSSRPRRAPMGPSERHLPGLKYHPNGGFASSRSVDR